VGCFREFLWGGGGCGGGLLELEESVHFGGDGEEAGAFFGGAPCGEGADESGGDVDGVGAELGGV